MINEIFQIFQRALELKFSEKKMTDIRLIHFFPIRFHFSVNNILALYIISDLIEKYLENILFDSKTVRYIFEFLYDLEPAWAEQREYKDRREKNKNHKKRKRRKKR